MLLQINMHYEVIVYAKINKLMVRHLPWSKAESLMKNAPMITPTMINILKNQNLQKDM